jgi:hypothetical protein
MQTHDDVLAALQSAHDAEATASAAWHKQEHEFKAGPGKYPKLGKWFDRRHKEAADREHDLRRHIQKLGGKVETNLGDTSYWQHKDVKTDEGMKALFNETADTLESLHDKHAAVYAAAEKARDRETCEKFHGVHHEIKEQARKARKQAQHVADLGLSDFLSKHV